MSLTQDAAGTLRRADGRPAQPSPPAHLKAEVAAILQAWDLT